MTNLHTATVPEIIAELRRRRDEIETGLKELGTTEEIVEAAVIRSFRITREDLHSDLRPERITLPRQAAMALMREHGMTWSSCGAHFGKDHGTAAYAAKKIAEREATDVWLAEVMRGLRSSLAAALHHSQD